VDAFATHRAHDGVPRGCYSTWPVFIGAVTQLILVPFQNFVCIPFSSLIFSKHAAIALLRWYQGSSKEFGIVQDFKVKKH
jgi:hypothetical protein